ncbi:MAG TPA: SH3 domain-containing protein [Firmicutes bacterium]|nr:SH3 domain-containing protein [Bacillota bacterium]
MLWVLALSLSLVFCSVLPWPEGAVASAAPIEVEGLPATVVGDVCNLRTGPGTSYAVAGRVVAGNRVTVNRVRDNWLLVTYQGKQGWIAGWLVDVDLAARGAVAVVEKAAVNVRRGPGLDYPVVGRTDRGDRYPAQALRGDWVRIARPDGVAWVWAPLVRVEMGSPPAPLPGPGPSPSPAPTPDPGRTPSPAPAPSPGQGEGGLDLVPGMLVYPVQEEAKVWLTAVKGSEAIDRLTPVRPGRYAGTKDGWVAIEVPGPGGQAVRGWVWGPEVRLEWPEDRSVYYQVSEHSWSMGKYRSTVVKATNVNFRAGPGTGYRVVGRVDRGDRLRVLDTFGEWIKAVNPQGTVGWVASWLTAGITPVQEPFQVSLEARENSRRLTVAGSFTSAVVRPEGQGASLVVSTSSFFSGKGILGVGSFEFDRIQLGGSDVQVILRERPSYQVVENRPGRVVVDFHPAVGNVVLDEQDDRDILRLETLGHVWPRLSRQGPLVELWLPGAAYEGQQRQLTGRYAGQVTVSAADGGVRLRAHTGSGTACVLRKGSNNLELHILRPGLAGKRIVIDPGHGGDSTGAIGPSGLAEKRPIGKSVAALLISCVARGRQYN